MRSRILVGGTFAVLMLVIVSTCRQQSSTSPSPTDGAAELPTPEAVRGAAEPASGTVATEVTDSRSAASGDAEAQSQDFVGQTAMLTAEDPEAVINVRSLPSPTSDPIGLGRVGEPVVLGRSESAEDGYTWYYVTFKNTSTVGWVRSDLIDLPVIEKTSSEASVAKSSAPQSDALKRALDEHCGDTRAIESYFVTPTYTMYVCKIRNQHFYLSQEAGTEQVVTAREVEAVGGGYIISNGNFEYRLDSSSFVVVRFDDSGKQEEVLRESVVYTERFE